MRVLVANKFWYRRGGLERVMFDEIAWLESAGHQVAHFSTAHPLNDLSPWREHFVPYMELGGQAELGVSEKVVAALRMFDNREAARRFTSLIDEFRPDIVHIHGIHRQLSPSILDVARRRAIPVVQTLHDYHQVCPADTLLKGGGAICEPRACGKHWFGAAIINRCVRGSLAASSLSALETGYQRSRGAYEKTVRRFICPSAFLADRMAEGGLRVPCDVVPNAVSIQDENPRPRAEYVLYAGRLSPEKGISVLLEAAKRAGLPVMVAGEGPLDEVLRRQHPEASFRGRLSGEGVQGLIDEALACAVPSIWYENAPLSVLEPMASGVPVVASAIGGVPELIEDGVSGLLVTPGNVDALASALMRVRDEEGLSQRLGAEARRRVAERFSPQRHLDLLLESYEAAMH